MTVAAGRVEADDAESTPVQPDGPAEVAAEADAVADRRWRTTAAEPARR